MLKSFYGNITHNILKLETTQMSIKKGQINYFKKQFKNKTTNTYNNTGNFRHYIPVKGAIPK